MDGVTNFAPPTPRITGEVIRPNLVLHDRIKRLAGILGLNQERAQTRAACLPETEHGEWFPAPNPLLLGERHFGSKFISTEATYANAILAIQEALDATYDQHAPPPSRRPLFSKRFRLDDTAKRSLLDIINEQERNTSNEERSEILLVPLSSSTRWCEFAPGHVLKRLSPKHRTVERRPGPTEFCATPTMVGGALLSDPSLIAQGGTLICGGAVVHTEHGRWVPYFEITDHTIKFDFRHESVHDDTTTPITAWHL